MIRPPCRSFFFFFNDTATTEIYTLSLHDALPISVRVDGYKRGARRVDDLETDNARLVCIFGQLRALQSLDQIVELSPRQDRKSTRLNSSHLVISYAVFCLKKKNTNKPRCNS